MADVASRYDPARHARSQLTSFRIRELKDVLARLGLPKQGKKQILLDKIMELIVPAEKQPLTRGLRKKVVSREEAIAIIDEQYRKLRNSGTEVTKSKAAQSGSSSGTPSAVPKPSRTEETKTRCPCGSHIDAGIMIQCDDPKCRVWQHMTCVVHPEKPTDGAQPEVPPNHFCELCRINRGDPFCVPEKHILNPMKLLPSAAKTGGSNSVQNIQKSFYVNATDRDLLRKPEYDLQVWCVLLSDKVSFRNHWPSYADLKINGESVRVTSRPGQQLLGLNGRDEGQSIKSCMKEGLNMFMMSAYDTRPFCLGVRLIRRLSLEQVMNLIPSEADGEPLEEAMARVRRCINGGGGQGLGGDDDGSDSDLEVMAEYISVNLRCPMSGSRIKVAGRFKPCLHMGCFDLDTYVELNQRARKWQCPICLKNYSIEHLIIDPFFNRITNPVETLNDEITEVELKADGSWRPKPEGKGRNGDQPWRPFPGAAETNGSGGLIDKPASFSHHVKVEQELSSHDFRLQKSNVRQRLNGGPSQQQVLNVITPTRSSSATDSNLKANVDELSVNQDPSERNVVSLDDNDEAEISSRPQPASGAANPIILSDSDDEGAEAEADVEVVEDDDDDEVVGSSFAESDARVQSPDNDPSRLALGLASTAALPYDPLINRALGLQLDTNSVWTAATERQVHKYHRPHLEPQRVPPVRPTPVQATGNGFLSGRSRHEATTDVVSVDSDTTASPLQEFLPAQPARAAEVSELSRGPLYIDNSWFSLSLGGGGKDMAEAAPARSIRASSVERFPPFRQPRVPITDINSRGLHGRNGSSLRLMDLRPPVRSHFTAGGHPFPVRPRSSPMYAARRVHRPIRMDDSDLD